MRSPCRRLLAVIALVLSVPPPPVRAQYFGRNKVQYETFHFEVLKTAHFDVYYYAEERLAAEQAGRMAERWFSRLSKMLEHQLSDRQPIILYASHPHFEQTNAIRGELGEATGGVTEYLKRRIVMPLAGTVAESDHVLGHEMVHAFQFDMTARGEPAAGAVPGALQLPLWFIEGMAEYLSLGPVDPHTAMWLRDAARSEKLPTVKQLGDPQFFPYRYGQAFWAYLGGRYGDPVLAEVLKSAGASGKAEKALEEVLGIDVEQLSREWHASIQEAYGGLAAVKKSAADYGRAVITDKNAGELNVGPALSPDGRRLVFLSEKDRFSIDLFLADADTGRVTRRIVKTAVDPHFESLQFINSAGSWDPSGRRFAFGAVSKGHPVLTVIDVEDASVASEVPFPELGEIFSPTWSPDGRRIAFSAIKGGLTDLYLYDLAGKHLERLTDDAYADLQPAWSPDGASIAFVTDRFSTNLEGLDAGDYGLALLDVRSGEIRALPAFEGAKNINPQWGPGPATLYFLSDRYGISNVYRLQLDDGVITQVTDLLTGASGITRLSPALATATGSGRVAFSAYEEGQYRIYTIDDAERRTGGPLLASSDVVSPALLPPARRAASQVAAVLRNAAAGLPARASFDSRGYRPKLSIDYVGQPQFGVGVNRYGTAIAGGGSLYLSDMLGDQNLGAFLQANGGLKDIGGAAAYVNLKSRWNWGATVQQIPYVTGSFLTGVETVQGQPALVQQLALFRQTDRALSGVVAYPFDRARRLELTTGYSFISFDREVLTRTISLDTGRVLSDERRKLPASESLHLAMAGAAFVHDTSTFGATSPILGTRYRLEVSPMIGAVSFTGVLADWRTYWMPVRPYTLAIRLLHYGRYGGDAESSPFSPLFLGYSSLVRGYDTGSFSAAECGKGPDCPAFDRLLGSRVAVANVELRFPLFGALGRRRLYAPVPLELGAFADAGIAWTSRDRAQFLGGDRTWVRSVGAMARLNLFGYAVVELDLARPLDRPRREWQLQFNLRPGF
jgi:Tol biopolymer transport system component